MDGFLSDRVSARLVGLARGAGAAALRAYHAHTVTGHLANPDRPVLFVAHHGFGGVFDLNVVATMAAFEAMRLDRPVTAMTHHLAWVLRTGPLLEPFGARPARRDEALAAFERGEHVLVLPGGDVDAFKSQRDRNKVIFDGRDGFAALAIECGVPIVPVVTFGAGNTALVLSDGQLLARLLRLDRLARLKAVPISVTVPWGLSVGVAGFLPYLPLPARLATSVLPPMHHEAGESAPAFASRVQDAMQVRLHELAMPMVETETSPREYVG